MLPVARSSLLHKGSDRLFLAAFQTKWRQMHSCREQSIARPRRSMLYVPGSNLRALEKAKSIPSDSLILDLEDAVAPTAKEAARENVKKALKEGGFGKREVTVRVNGLDTPWGLEDLKDLCYVGPDAIILPKVEGGEQIQTLEQHMAYFGAPAHTAIGAMIETPKGVLNVNEIAASNERLTMVVMGTSDLTTDLRARHTRTREPMLASLGLVILAARAHGIAAIDGVALDLEDDEAFRWACEQARNMGYDGKTLIHPKTIDVANEVFGPDAAAVEHAHEVIRAYEAAVEEGQGVATLGGKLIENLHAAEAKRLVAYAARIAELSTS